MQCKVCGGNLVEGARFCGVCGSAQDGAPVAAPAPAPAPVSAAKAAAGMNFDFSGNGVATAPAKPRYEYKVLTQKDKWFSGKFDPMLLEQAINAYAQQGWRVIGCATADVPGFGTNRQEFITLLERER